MLETSVFSRRRTPSSQSQHWTISKLRQRTAPAVPVSDINASEGFFLCSFPLPFKEYKLPTNFRPLWRCLSERIQMHRNDSCCVFIKQFASQNTEKCGNACRLIYFYNNNLDTTRVLIGQKPMGYCANRKLLLLTLVLYDRMSNGFTGAIKPRGMLRQHEKNLLITRLWLVNWHWCRCMGFSEHWLTQKWKRIAVNKKLRREVFGMQRAWL